MLTLRIDSALARRLLTTALVAAIGFSPSVVAMGTDDAHRTSEVVPSGLSSGEWSSIRAAYEANRHTAFAVEGGWQARNPGQQWKSRFDGRGFETEPDGGGWTWGLELERYGFAGAECVVTQPAMVNAVGQRVAYDWDATLEEWYVNDTRGLEHGFTVRDRPAAGDGPLTLTLAVRGELFPVVSDDVRAVHFMNRDGTAVLNYSGLTVLDAVGHELAASFEVVAGRIRLSIDESGARYPLTIDPIAQQAYLKASNTGAFDYFGSDVSIAGDTVVVGAYLEDSSATGVNGNPSDNSMGGAGAAYVFVRSGTRWSQQAYLKASNTDAGDLFGISVSVSGDTVVVGAIGEESNATGVNGNQSDNGASNSGAAYVFVRSGTTWSQQAYLKASNTDLNAYFGASVSVSGDTVLVGAYGDDSNAIGVNGNQSDNTAFQAGAAYVFVRSGATWSQQAYLKASNTGAGDQFGISVSVSDDTVLVGASQESSNATDVNGSQSDNSASLAGAAYVFVRSGTTWSQQAYLKASNTGAFDSFGEKVSVSGDTVVVGARREDSNATGVDGNQSDNSMGVAGAAYVFVRSGTTWSQQAYLKASNTDVGDYFGISVSVSDDTVVVGASGESSNATGVNGVQSDNSAGYSGAAYVFMRSGTTWSQAAYLKASNTDAGDLFGSSVSVSGDTVVGGAWLEDSDATGVNGDQSDNSGTDSGAAYVFDLAAWLDLGSGLAGVNGVPKLVGTGTLITGSAGALDVTKAAGSAPAILVAALSTTPMTVLCGTLLPTILGASLISFPTDTNGRVLFLWPSWPAGLSGLSLFCQWIVADTAAPCTVSFSNAVRGDVP